MVLIIREQKRLLYKGGLLALSIMLAGCSGGGVASGIGGLLPGGEKRAKAKEARQQQAAAQPSAAEQDRILAELQDLRNDELRRSGQLNDDVATDGLANTAVANAGIASAGTDAALAQNQAVGVTDQSQVALVPTQPLPSHLSEQDRILAEARQRQAQAAQLQQQAGQLQQNAIPAQGQDIGLQAQQQLAQPQQLAQQQLAQTQTGLPASEVAQLQDQAAQAQAQTQAVPTQADAAQIQNELAQLQAQAQQGQTQTSSFFPAGQIVDQEISKALTENEAVYRNVDTCLRRGPRDFRNAFDGRPDLLKVVDEKNNQLYQNSDKSILILTTDKNCDISFTGKNIENYTDGLIHILKAQGAVVEKKNVANLDIISVSHPRGSFRLANGIKVIGQGGSTNFYTTIKAL